VLNSANSYTINNNLDEEEDLNNVSVDTTNLAFSPPASSSNVRSVGSLTSRKLQFRKKHLDSNSTSNSIGSGSQRLLKRFRKSSSGNRLSNLNKQSLKSNLSVPLINVNNVSNMASAAENQLNLSEKCSIMSNQTVSYMNKNSNENSGSVSGKFGCKATSRNLIKQLDLPD
jgi:hypothetical protein